MDQGVIWSFKCSFRKHLLEYVLSLIEDEQPIMKAEVDIRMAMHLVKKAWVSVRPHVLINAFMNAGFKSTLIQTVMQPPEDKCDLIEDFTHYEFVSHQAKHGKEDDECDAVNAPEVISIKEVQKLLDQLKLFALANARSSGRLLECTIDLGSAFVDFLRRAKLR
ncbi:unnamed protein product [Echinostoma caproni]|uniref:DDE-1 domain-containing protein n=1 Tax=Echinostoma caproni TaxID=27848 RepID=A0A183ADG9_9TREM|nr:unnamed protein product [Echinostoma caproni]